MKNIEFLKNSLIAHRGLHDLDSDENTIKSFTKAIDKNYTIEFDIHILIDNSIVIYHDYNLKRLTGINKIIETLDYLELSKLKIKKKYSIPTLSQVLNLVNGKVPLLIEVKDLNNNSRFEEELVKILDSYNGKFAIQSMNPFVIDWFYENRPNYIIGLIVLNDLNFKVLKKHVKKVDFIAINKKSLPFKSKKMVIGWTITNKEELDKYKLLADNLICEKVFNNN